MLYTSASNSDFLTFWMMATTSYLTPTQSYAAGALFGLALHQAQIHQTHPLGSSTHEEELTDEGTRTSSSSSSSNDAVSEDPELWVHQNSGLLRPVFKWVSSFFTIHILNSSTFRFVVYNRRQTNDDWNVQLVIYLAEIKDLINSTLDCNYDSLLILFCSAYSLILFLKPMRFISNALAYLLGLIVNVDTFTFILISSASKSMSMELVFDFIFWFLIF